MLNRLLIWTIHSATTFEEKKKKLREAWNKGKSLDALSIHHLPLIRCLKVESQESLKFISIVIGSYDLMF